MSWNYPYYKYQVGGERNLPVITNPRRFSRLYGINKMRWKDLGAGLPSYIEGEERDLPVPDPIGSIPMLPVITDPRAFARLYGAPTSQGSDLTVGVPSRTQMEEIFQRQLAEQAIRRQEVEARKRKTTVAHGEIPKLKNPDLTAMGKRQASKDATGVRYEQMTDDKVAQWKGEQRQLYRDLLRQGYSPVHAAAFTRMGKERLEPFMQKQLEDQAEIDYQVRNHPDYDPAVPVEYQQGLNYDNSLRARVLRGRNKLANSDYAAVSLIGGALTGSGDGAGNQLFDFHRRNIQPIEDRGWAGVPEVLGNIGWDVFNMLTVGGVGLTSKLAPKIARRGLPEASLAMERSVLNARRILKPPITSEEVKKAAYDYYDLTKDPRYMERARALDKELGMDGELERRIKLFHEQGEDDLGKELPFNIQIKQPSNRKALASSGVKSWTLDERPPSANEAAEVIDISTLSKEELDELLGGMELPAYPDYYSPQSRDILIAPDVISSGYDLPETVHHELKHHAFNGLKDNRGKIQYYADLLRSVIPEDIEKKWLPFVKRENLPYLKKSTEIDAYTMTNIRDKMVKQGYLKDHFDLLTKDKLNAFLRRNQLAMLVDKAMGKQPSPAMKLYFSPFSSLIKDKNRYIEVFNKALPMATGVGVGLGAMQVEKQQRGGEVPSMPIIGAFLNRKR